MTPQSDVALAPHTTMGVGGAARWFVEASSESAVCAALRWAGERRTPAFILGGGSNIVIADRGFDGLVVKIAIRGIEVSDGDGQLVYAVGAGEPWDAVVEHAVGANCAGLECLSGIPGLAGGTPVQNVGAYGQEVSDTVQSVHVVDRVTNQISRLTNHECGFGYRTSRFKRADAGRFVVTRIDYQLTPGGPPTVTYADLIAYFAEAGQLEPSLSEVRQATLAVRRRKGMVIEPGNAANRSCGSFFVNPVIDRRAFETLASDCAPARVPHYVVADDRVKIPAAWLIERAGFTRGRRHGAVGISPFQAQAIINHGGAGAEEVLMLAHAIKRAVWDTFRIALGPEPQFVGFPRSPEFDWLTNPER
jgi:UDP-N-acetylmuramate dehydrogenase